MRHPLFGIMFLYGNKEDIDLNLNTKKKIKAAGVVLFVIYILVLIYFLFFAEEYGRVSYTTRDYQYNLVPFLEIRRFWIYRNQVGTFAMLSNIFGNVVGFIPFGLIPPIISRNSRSFFFITFSGLTLSLFVEVTQLISRAGCFDVDDLILNTLGTAIGYILFAIAHKIYRTGRK